MLVTRSSSAFLILALAASACETKQPGDGPATPPENPTANSTANSTAEPAAKSTSTAAKKSFAAAAKFDIVPLAVGQWVRLLVTTKGQPPAQTFVRIVGKEGDAFWYEIESNTPNGTTVVQFLMDEASRANFSKNAIKKMKMKVGLGPVQEFSGATLAAASAVTDSYISLIGKPNLDKAERADVTVTAGEFKGCYVHEIEQSVMGISVKVKSWNHPAVPINGFVRSESATNGIPTATELFEMHMDGAKSVLP